MSVATSGSTSAGGSSDGSDSERKVRADKLDILFVVDNSIAMGDTHPLLAPAAVQLVDRIANPRCVPGDDPALSEGCPEGQQREFAPVVDLHLGVISTSLGSAGGVICSPESPNYNPTQNDRARLMPSVREGLTSYKDQGFLAWDGLEVDTEAEHDLDNLKSTLSQHIVSVGERGCGFEAPLEAMYRFLIDPSPPQEIVVTGAVSHPARDATGQLLVDDELLEQRAAFLRPDSAVVVVLLSDEDDCSVQGNEQAWLLSHPNALPRATQVCEVDPNDRCCRSCSTVNTPAGCAPVAEDPNCSEPRTLEEDSLNLRCFDQKRRFGFELLNPVARYVAGLQETQIEDTSRCTNQECPVVRNPLFPPDNPELAFTRRASEVFVVGLVGVPWQDLATPESLNGPGVTYKSAYDADDWSMIVGSPSNYVPAGDPLMIASPDPRSGTHPITGEALAPADSTNPIENTINGHEFVNVYNDTLQYACIFPLSTPRDCSGNGPEFCECRADLLGYNKPLCQPPGGGDASTLQHYAGATPGLRQLELMSKLPHAVPASLCPKDVAGDPGNWAYGYNPAMHALVSQLSSVLK